jgi:hypothetical protein
MEKDNKRKATPDINEELMMNLMVDGIKKDGLQLPPEPAEKPEKQDIKPDMKLPKDQYIEALLRRRRFLDKI